MKFITLDSSACQSWNLEDGLLMVKLKYPMVFDQKTEFALFSYSLTAALVNFPKCIISYKPIGGSQQWKKLNLPNLRINDLVHFDYEL